MAEKRNMRNDLVSKEEGTIFEKENIERDKVGLEKGPHPFVLLHKTLLNIS
jgi:hypothetical protein